MKQYCNRTIGSLLCMLSIYPIYGMQMNGQTGFVDKVSVNYDVSANVIIHVFPIVSEWQMYHNKAELFHYVLFGDNKTNYLRVIKKDTWSDFALNYEEVITVREYARQVYRGARAAVANWWKGKGLFSDAKFQYVISKDDVNTAAYTVLAKLTNGVYSANDALDKKDAYSKPVDPIRIYVEQSGEGKDQVTTIIVFALLEVRKSIAALNTDGKNKYKGAFMWYPTHTLISENAIPSKIDLQSVGFLKKYFGVPKI